MLTIKETVKSGRASYYKVFFICPECEDEFPIVGSVFFCPGCFKSIVDFKDILDDENYALQYHFNLVRESGLYAGLMTGLMT